MISAQVITVVDPLVSPENVPVCCTHYTHSKFVHRKKYVESTLLPALLSLGFDARMFPAVVDTDFTREGDNISYDKLCLKNLKVAYGGIGCFLSHVSLWSLCVARNETILILEDDALLPDTSVATISVSVKEYDDLPDYGDILYLLGALPYHATEMHLYMPQELKPVSSTLCRVSPVRDLSGTAAYAIKPKAAQKLLDRIQKIPMCAVDGFIHGAVKDKELTVVVPKNFKHVFMLNEHFAEWNHTHMKAPDSVKTHCECGLVPEKKS